jgi:predicted MFS family arabinose efflux permease
VTPVETGRNSSRRYAGYVLCVLALANAFNFLDRQILAILLEPIRLDLGASDTVLGFLSGPAFALFYALAGVPIARWIDRGSRTAIMIGGIVLWSAMTAACGIARNTVQLAIARTLVGVGEATQTPSAHSLISDYFAPRRRATALAMNSAGASAGLLVGLALGGWIADAYGWRWTFIAVGTPGLAVALLVYLTVREPERVGVDAEGAESSAESFSQAARALWGLRTYRHVALGASLQALFGYTLISWGPAFMSRVHGWSAGDIGLPLGLILGVGGVLGALLGGALSDRLGARDARWYVYLPALTAVGMTPFALLFLHWPSGAGMLWYAPAVILGNFYPAPSYALAQNLVAPRMRGTSAAVMLLFITIIGLGVGPQLVGVLNDRLAPRLGDLGIRYSLSLVALANLWAAGHFLWASRSLKRELQAREQATLGVS